MYRKLGYGFLEKLLGNGGQNRVVPELLGQHPLSMSVTVVSIDALLSLSILSPYVGIGLAAYLLIVVGWSYDVVLTSGVAPVHPTPCRSPLDAVASPIMFLFLSHVCILCSPPDE